MYYVILFISLSLFSLYLYCKFEDIWSPSLMISVITALSSLSAFIGRLSWNFVDLSWQITIIVLIGVFMFYLGEIIVRTILKKIHIPKLDLKEIRINKLLNYAILFYLVFIIFWIYFDLMRITGIHDNIAQMISTYRMDFTAINPDFNRADGLNFLLTQLYKTVLPIIITYIFINVNNYFSKNKIVFQNIIPIIIGIGISLLISGRSEAITITIFFTFVVIYNLFLKEKEHKKVIIKIIKLIAIVGIIGLPTFYFMLPLLGRSVPSGIIEYITFYLGCPLPTFDYWLHNFYPVDGFNLSLNFVGVQRILNKMNIIETFQVIKYKFVSFDCNLSSNAYGAFFNYYNVFGYIGIVVLPFIASFIISTFKKVTFKLSNGAFISIYLYIFSMMIDQYRSEVIFNKVLDYDFIFKMCLIPLLFYLINYTSKNSKEEVSNE